MYQLAAPGGAPVYPPTSVYLIPGSGHGGQMAPQFTVMQAQASAGPPTPTSSHMQLAGVPMAHQQHYYFPQAAAHAQHGHPGQPPQQQPYGE